MEQTRTSWRSSQPEADKPAARADLLVAAWAARDHGVLNADELESCGLDRQAISVRARNGRFHRVYRGVYAVGHDGLSPKGRYIAAVKACGAAAVLSHRSAAELWGLIDGEADPPHVTVPTMSHRQRRGIRIHRTGVLDDEWLILDRIRVTTPVRSIIDLAADLDTPSLRDVLRRAVGTRRMRFGQLIRALARVGPRPGVKKLRRLIADGVPTRSELEDVVLHLIDEGGFERPDVNVPLILDGRRVIPDFRWPAERLVLEVDGAAWHDNPVARAADLDRQRLLEAHVETVLRVTWRQAVGDPAGTNGRILEAGAPLRRSWRVAQPEAD